MIFKDNDQLKPKEDSESTDFNMTTIKNHTPNPDDKKKKGIIKIYKIMEEKQIAEEGIMLCLFAPNSLFPVYSYPHLSLY